ncbi:PIR Superfamily Protein [Plasmodium ovale curtisi]|uniref:PIR Superfamily Protein n=1 Tax=Plasmodium ovale curtisi TaxID=864141 RepID=A0A1A8WUL8_PLAOA|nr:PIR Superfamily Protein [Plasmodium ovale curtisi]
MADIDYNLSILNSNVFYNKLDEASEDYRLNSEQYWNHIINYTCIKKTSFFDTLLKGFYYVSYMEKDEMFHNDRWNYLYFWAGSKVLENLKGCSFMEIVYLVKSVRKHIDVEEYNSYIDEINEEEFKELNIVHDFLVNYDSIKFYLSAHNYDCTAKYKEYVDSHYDAYVKLKEKCKENEEKAYCKMFKDFEQKKNYENLEKLTCHGKMPPLSVKDKKSELSLYGGQDEDLKEEMHTGTTSPSSVTDNMMSTYFPILGIFSTFFLLYSFTPFRSWLRNFLSKKKNIRHGINEDTSDEFFENVYEPSDTNSQYNRHDISYHSIINT